MSMRVMIDTNVILSAIYNTKSKPANVFRHVCENHELVLCDYIIAECYDVITRKFPQNITAFNKLLATLGYELVAAPREGLAMIDPKDSPILNAAINADVDFIISGDKHFLALDLERPQVLSPSSYCEIEGLV